MRPQDLRLGIAPGRSFSGDWWAMVEICQRLNLSGVEFKYELPFILPERWSWEMVKRIASLAKEQGWFLSLHGPYTNIGSLLSKRWQTAVDEHLEALEVAQALGAKTYTIHPGWVEEKYCTADLLQRCKDRTKEALAILSARGEGVRICVENQNPSEKEKVKAGVSPENLHYLVQGSPDLMFTFDLGHAHIFNGQPEKFAVLLGPQRIAIAHIHDNLGEADAHLPPGRGTVNWEAFLWLYRVNRWDFPLFLETVGGEAEFRAGRDFIMHAWEKLWVKEGTDV